MHDIQLIMFRKIYKLNAKTMAHALGVSNKTYRKWERGNPTPKWLNLAIIGLEFQLTKNEKSKASRFI